MTAITVNVPGLSVMRSLIDTGSGDSDRDLICHGREDIQ